MASSENRSSSQPVHKYIYQLPYSPRRELVRILDDNNQWQDLGGLHMKYDVTTLNFFGRTKSPTDSLLNDWGQKNHTIKDLFILLSRMQHYRAMEVLKPYVESKYHVLCNNGECGMSALFKTNFHNGASAVVGPAPPTLQLASLESSRGSNSSRPKPSVDSCNFNTPQSDRSLPCKLASFPMSDARQIPSPAEPSRSRSENGPGTWASTQPVAISPTGGAAQAASSSLRQSPGSSLPSELNDISSTSSVANILHIEESQLMQATRNWSTASILGRGGFGTVYKGTWMSTEVAIKRMENKGLAGAEKIALQQSKGELRILNAIRHDNILPLYGYSLDGTFPCLVYEFMPNGSLEDRLLCKHGTQPLSGKQRLNIARGTARGLNFLHSRSTKEKPLIHGDIKSANILLDKAFDPKIGDFGLAREGPQTQHTHIKVSCVRGTRPYLPDEYLRGKKISTKVDTYSFGIVLFELGTGARAYDDTRESPYLRDHVENSRLGSLRDQKAGFDWVELYEPVMNIGKTCTLSAARDRPEMKKVLEDLDQLATEFESRLNGTMASKGLSGLATTATIPSPGFWPFPPAANGIPLFSPQPAYFQRSEANRSPFGELRQFGANSPVYGPKSPQQWPVRPPMPVAGTSPTFYSPTLGIPPTFFQQIPLTPLTPPTPPTHVNPFSPAPVTPPVPVQPVPSLPVQPNLPYQPSDPSLVAMMRTDEGPAFDLLMPASNGDPAEVIPNLTGLGLKSTESADDSSDDDSNSSSGNSTNSSRSSSSERNSRDWNLQVQHNSRATSFISSSDSAKSTATREKTIPFFAVDAGQTSSAD